MRGQIQNLVKKAQIYIFKGRIIKEELSSTSYQQLGINVIKYGLSPIINPVSKILRFMGKFSNIIISYAMKLCPYMLITLALGMGS